MANIQAKKRTFAANSQNGFSIYHVVGYQNKKRTGY